MPLPWPPAGADRRHGYPHRPPCHHLTTLVPCEPPTSSCRGNPVPTVGCGGGHALAVEPVHSRRCAPCLVERMRRALTRRAGVSRYPRWGTGGPATPPTCLTTTSARPPTTPCRGASCGHPPGRTGGAAIPTNLPPLTHIRHSPNPSSPTPIGDPGGRGYPHQPATQPHPHVHQPRPVGVPLVGTRRGGPAARLPPTPSNPSHTPHVHHLPQKSVPQNI